MSTENPHSARLKAHKEGTEWGFAPYDRAMKQIAETEAADQAKVKCVRTLEDLLEAASLEDEIDEESLNVTLEDMKAIIKAPSKEDKTKGRNALIAKLKQGGVEKLSHRQALASAAMKAQREGKLRPRKPGADAAADDAPEKPQKREEVHKSVPWDERFAAQRKEIQAKANAVLEGGADPPPNAAADEPKPPPLKPEEEPKPVEEPPLEAGQKVKCIALLSRPDLNGQIALVVDGPNDRGRYTIDIRGEKIALKRENLASVEKPVEIA